MPAKILVVDDEVGLERLIRQRFRKKIKTKEFDFLFAPNGVAALDQLQADGQVDMVLTDINMPSMDGLTLLTHLAKIDQTLKAVVMSAYGDIPNIRRAMNRGAFDFLTKPIDFQDLEVTIQKTLAFVQQIRQTQQQIQQTQQALLHAAYYDSLTGLPNRSWFVQRLTQLIEQQQQDPKLCYAVLFIDLDRFKLINDSLGHTIGDLLLQTVAQRLLACLPETGVVARLGGDEFAVLLESIQSPAEATAIANQIQMQLRHPFQLEHTEVYSEASIGIALSQTDSRYERPEEMLRDADVAMYCAKAQGRGRFEVFDPVMQIRAKEYLDLENDLRRAIDRGELGLHYQPIVSTKTGLLHSFETLVRWQHPTQGMVSPSKFIPLAEETRLVVPLGWWVFETACRQLRQWQQQFPHHQGLCLNVNFSAIQLQQVDLVAQIQRTLQRTGLSGKNLKLEITESYLLENITAQTTILQQLKELGIQFCIDDFGIGYSSLSRLHEFPIDILKIDRSFIQRIEQGSDANLATIRMIISLAHSLEMEVVAEGIETPEQMAVLRELGCNFAQGYLFSRPVDSHTAHQFLRSSYSF
jgi:diguanylate cyclase (GGDEF)-like protein